MSYIGNQPTSVAFLTDQFSGNGSTTVFTMSVAPATTSSILVAITGVVQDPSTYSVTGTTLTFSAAPPSGTGNISVRYLGIPASGVTTTAYRTVTEFTATAGQTTFTPPSYTVGYLNVYMNGVLLGSADYTATNGTTVVLASGAVAGALITTQSFYVSSVLNALPQTGGTVSGNLVVAGTISSGGNVVLNGSTSGTISLAATAVAGTTTLTLPATSGTVALTSTAVTRSQLPAGSVLQVVSTTKTDTFSTTSNPTFVDVTGWTVNITPTSATSKFLVYASSFVSGGANNAFGYLKLQRNGTDIAIGDSRGSSTQCSMDAALQQAGTVNTWAKPVVIQYLDSPSTASAITYKIVARAGNTGVSLFIGGTSDTVDSNRSSVPTIITVMEIAA